MARLAGILLLSWCFGCGNQQKPLGRLICFCMKYVELFRVMQKLATCLVVYRVHACTTKGCWHTPARHILYFLSFFDARYLIKVVTQCSSFTVNAACFVSDTL